MHLFLILTISLNGIVIGLEISETNLQTYALSFASNVNFTSAPFTTSPSNDSTNCDFSSYPDFCIPPPPPNLNCDDVDGKDFTVFPPDPHGFDRDKDGEGCETSE